MSTTWRLTYTDGSVEEIKGYRLRSWEGVLTIEQNHSGAYNRNPRSWPMANLRSWEEVS